MKGIPSFAVSAVFRDIKPSELGQKLRLFEKPIVARIDADRLFFELRTLTEQEQEEITNALLKIKNEK
jgi:hypothetical protein